MKSKPLKTLFALFVIFALSFASSTASPREDAENLVRETVTMMRQKQTAKLWESFSESSRDKYRKALLEGLTARRELPEPNPPAPDVDAKYPQRTEEQQWEDERKSRVPNWRNDLIRLGLPADLEEVKAMSNREFWEAWLSELYLQDLEYHGSESSRPRFPMPGPEQPAYRVEAVAVEGAKFYVIMRIPYEMGRDMIRQLPGMDGYPWSMHEMVDSEKRMVWSGVIENRQLHLDVPDEWTRMLEIQTFSAKQMKLHGK